MRSSKPKNYSNLENSLAKDIMHCVDDHRDELVKLITDLVSMDSLLGNENEAQNFVSDKFQNLGLTVERFEINHELLKDMPGYSPTVGNWDKHENVVGTFTPKSNLGRSLILNGHIDVVPVGHEDLWTSPPFKPVVRDDLIFGRGSGDMKGGMAAFIVAFSIFKKLGLEPNGKIHLQSVVEEECTGNGALACLHRGFKADAAIIPEPFNETIMSAQVGVMWVNIEVVGKPSHVLNANEGTSAIEGAFSLWQSLKLLEKKWNLESNRHTSFLNTNNPIKFNLGVIEGGEWASSLATRCQMQIRVGFFPGEEISQVCKKIEDTLKQTIEDTPHLRPLKFKLKYGGFQSEGCEVDLTSPFIATLNSSHFDVSNEDASLFASSATTDARTFNLYGDTPCTCYGPSANNIHGIDENVSITSVLRVTKVLALFISRWCGISAISKAS